MSQNVQIDTNAEIADAIMSYPEDVSFFLEKNILFLQIPGRTKQKITQYDFKVDNRPVLIQHLPARKWKVLDQDGTGLNLQIWF